MQSSGASAFPPPSDDAASAEAHGGLIAFKKEVQEVILHATVVDEQRRLVTNLDRAAFTVFEDGMQQATTSHGSRHCRLSCALEKQSPRRPKGSAGHHRRQYNASQGTLREAAPRFQQENGPTLYAVGLLSDELTAE